MASANPPSAALQNVFVYGSLLADDIVNHLLNRVPASSPAILHNHHRFNVKGRIYPAVVPVANKKIHGKVLLGITPLELHILDEFEDVEYERKTVDVYLTDSSKTLQAFTYIWSNKNDPNLYGEWDFEEWTRLHKEEFTKMTLAFVEELQLPESKSRMTTFESFYQENDGQNSAPDHII